MAALVLIVAALCSQNGAPPGPKTRAATPIRLDATDRPLSAIVESFGAPEPNRLAWNPDTPEAVRQRRVTIHEPDPLPFWTAIDRLCQAGDLHYIPGSRTGPGSPQDVEFRLYLAPGRVVCPRADQGPFRLEIVAIHHSRHLNLIPTRLDAFHSRGPQPQAYGHRDERFSVTLRMLAEPRMLISQVGDALITEAVDELGQSLAPGLTPYVYSYGLRYLDPVACTNYVLNLEYPERAGKRVARLKLTVPVEVTTYQPGPLEIPLADAVGKTFPHGQSSLTVLAIGKNPQGFQKVDIKLRTDEEAPERLTVDHTGAPDPGPTQPRTPELTPNVIQVVDRQGRQFSWHFGSSRRNGPEVTAELLLDQGISALPVRVGKGLVPVEERGTAVPAVLYHAEAVRRLVSATFTFSDVPLP
jgi:hypothetical protein